MNGTINGTTSSSEWTFKIVWDETAVSPQANTSTVRAQIYVGRANTDAYFNGVYNYTISINGTSTTSGGQMSGPVYAGGWQYIGAYEVSVRTGKKQRRFPLGWIALYLAAAVAE